MKLIHKQKGWVCMSGKSNHLVILQEIKTKDMMEFNKWYMCVLV